MTDTFPAAVVKELRDKADRYRRRVRVLERVLITQALKAEADRLGVRIAAFPDDFSVFYVDDDGTVHGAAEALTRTT